MANEQINLSRDLGTTNPIVNFHRPTVHFGTKDENSNVFNLEIQNAAVPASGDTGNRTVVLFPGSLLLIAAVPGMLTDGAFNDKNGNSGLTAISGETASIQKLQAYLASHPTELKGMHLQFSDVNQASQLIVVKSDDPFVQQDERRLRFATAFNQFSNNQNYLKVADMQEIIGAGSQFEYTLRAGATNVPNKVNITFYFGGSIDMGMWLKSMKEVAKNSISRVGVEYVNQYDQALTQRTLAMGAGN